MNNFKKEIKKSSTPSSINWWEVDWGNRRIVDIARQYGVSRQYASIQKQRCYSPLLSIAKRAIQEHKDVVKKLKKLCRLTWRDLSSVLNITWKDLNNGTLTPDEYNRVIKMLEEYEKKDI